MPVGQRRQVRGRRRDGSRRWLLHTNGSQRECVAAWHGRASRDQTHPASEAAAGVILSHYLDGGVASRGGCCPGRARFADLWHSGVRRGCS
jgi:hypothetical protein